MDKELLLSAEGLRKLEEELQYLKSVKRREVAQRIKQAREFGDLSENSEYEEAKNEQAFVEGRIIELEKMLRNARIVSDEEIDPSKVNIGSTVHLIDVDSGEEVCYTIVGSNEADPAALRISYQSPVGKALFGRSVGEVVEVRVPAGTLRYQIVRIERATQS